ncbi:hypothetical protein VHUM_01075 [Vanrija humicola]|uniref:SRP9 domain-containing protein n=1 Tax=Vanrija humicola TaxID=5417 RepID=A0A7D8Z2K5_VANHU|nr:hypothetical protein VHUM_01075 [Vanrija humicola]
MVYIKKWTDFESAVIELYNRAPRQTRYVVKFLPKTGQLVLKVTDDTKCIKYKTFSAIILNRFESLNLRLLSSITNARRHAPVLGGSGSAGAGTPTVEGDDPLKGGSGSNTPQRKGTPAATGGAGGAAGKKKKKGKR